MTMMSMQLIPQSHFTFGIIPGKRAMPSRQVVAHVLFYEDFSNSFNTLMKEYNLPIALGKKKVNPGKEGEVPGMGLGDFEPETILPSLMMSIRMILNA